MATQQNEDGSIAIDDEEKTQTPENHDDERVIETPENEGDEKEASDSDGDDREAIRERRRLERKAKQAKIKERDQSAQRLIAQQAREIAELRQRTIAIENKGAITQVAQVDHAIVKAREAAAYHEQMVAQATAAQDGPTLAKAMRNMIAAENDAKALESHKQQLVRQASQPQQSIRPEHNPNVVRHYDSFVDENPWFKPDDKFDIASTVALKINEKLLSQGFDPASDEFWDELHEQTHAALPHLKSNGNMTNSNEGGRQKPRSAVTGSGRDSASSSAGARSGTVLSAPRVAALKMAGIVDDNGKVLDKTGFDAYVKESKRWDREESNRR